MAVSTLQGESALTYPPASTPLRGVGMPSEAPGDPNPTAYPGMTVSRVWTRSKVHCGSKYFCGRCGKQFKTPLMVYRHIDAMHPAKKRRHLKAVK
jgi:hypothetical protein